MEALIFGNVTIDSNTIKGETVKSPGGSSLFTGLLLSNFNLNVTVVSPYGNDFRQFRPDKINFTPDNPLFENTLEFENIYNEDGSRSQKVKKIESSSFEKINLNIVASQNKDILIIAPILNNLQDKQIKGITRRSKESLKVLLPQGFFRKVEKDIVTQCECGIPESLINEFDIIVASEKDFAGIDKTAAIWGTGKSLVVITRGANPASVYFKDKKKDYPAFKVEDIKDETGAGDIFAAAFSFAYYRTRNIENSVYFAHAASALSLPLSSAGIKYGYKNIIEFAAGKNKILNI